MTISQDDPQSLPRQVVVNADYDAGQAHCPLCGHRLDGIGTPRIPGRYLSDDRVQGAVPARGYTCRRHRQEVVALEAVGQRPEGFVAVDGFSDREPLQVAVPAAVLEGVEA